MLRSGVLAEKEAILQRLESAKRRRDLGEVRRRLGELQYFTRLEDDVCFKQTRLDSVDQRLVDAEGAGTSRQD
jgi:hypothetical protein